MAPAFDTRAGPPFVCIQVAKFFEVGRETGCLSRTFAISGFA
jgi:hypothetical protein